METTVNLQGPFSYALWPVIITFLIVLSGITYAVVMLIIKIVNSKKDKPPVAIKVKPQMNLAAVKRKYTIRIDKIYNDVTSNKIDVRKAYQEMSISIRMFVHEATGIKTQKYTLTDIKTLNMPMLEELIVEYYIPEFANQSKGNVVDSLIKTKRIIEQWK